MTGSTQTVKGGQDGNDANNGKRAEWEQFGFSDLPNGNVQVCNHSHGEDAGKHTYEVETDADGNAVACSCPHHEFRNERCKHMIAVDERDDANNDEAEKQTAAIVMGANGENKRMSENDILTLINALGAAKSDYRDKGHEHMADNAWAMRDEFKELLDD